MNKAELDKHHNTSFSDLQLKAPILVMLCLSTAFIFYGALFPFHDWRIPARPTLTILLIDWLDHIFLFDIVQNLLLFMPFGLFFSCCLKQRGLPKKLTLWLPTLASFSISLTVELLQTFNPLRIPSLLDITLNVMSGFWGASMAGLFMTYYPWLLRQVANSIDFGDRQNLWPVLGIMTWLGFACYQIYPAIPTLHPQQLWEGISPVFQFFKGDVPFYSDRFLLYTLQGTMLYFSGKLFLKPTHSIGVLAGFISLMLLVKISIIGRHVSFEMLLGCYGSLSTLWMAQKMMDIVIIANKEEVEVSQ